ncbi:hypothetical protein DENSPDRAFT_523107 [Dentipellis sp. KUC8613]|nr:hypothetical protein DENSPDRAFT_523107 [Dentipellis sp. KUC8613]
MASTSILTTLSNSFPGHRCCSARAPARILKDSTGTRSKSQIVFSPEMYSPNNPNHGQPYPWHGSPNQFLGLSTQSPAQPTSTWAQWPYNTPYPSEASTAGDPTLGSHPSAPPSAETYAYDARHPHANAFQAFDASAFHSSFEDHESQYHAQASSASHTYGSQSDRVAPFSGGSGYQGYNPTAAASSTSPRGGRATTEIAPGYSGNYGESSGNNTIHISPYQPPSTVQHAEATAQGHKRKSRTDTTKAAHKAPQPVPAPPAGDNPGVDHAKKSITDAERLRKKALRQKSYRAKYTGVLRDLEDTLPESLKTHNDPPTRETVVRGVRCIKELRGELDVHKGLLRKAESERDAAIYERDVLRQELDYSKRAVNSRQCTSGHGRQ